MSNGDVTYRVASGAAVNGGKRVTPAWSIGLPALTFVDHAGTKFRDQINALTGTSGFLGSDPNGAIADAYSDWVRTLDGNGVEIDGGGHQNGSNNAKAHFDFYTLLMSLRMAPTPPSCYPPSMHEPNDPIIYPSGANYGYFADATVLTDPRDVSLAAPQNARAASHRYGATVVTRDGNICYFYGKYCEFNIKTGKEVYVDGSVDIGAMLHALNSNINASYPLGENTTATYHAGTNTSVVTLAPGSAGDSWRKGYFVWDHSTRTIAALHQGDIYSREQSVTLSTVGDWAYALCIQQSGNTVDCLTGWRFNFVTHALEWIKVYGDTFTYVFDGGTIAETVPMGYHGGRNSLVRWQYQDELNNLYEVTLTPTSGSGTSGDPWMLPQVRHVIAGSISTPKFIYNRLYHYPGADRMMFLPNADSNWKSVGF